MYIIKNAFKCIGRSKGRNILIGIIALVIAVSSCIGLSIRQAAESAKKSTLEGMTVTATISYDRQSMMSGMGNGGFNREEFADKMGSASSLTLDEYIAYAEAESVEDFYYTVTAYFNGYGTLEPVSTDTDSTDTQQNNGSFPTRPEGMGGNMGGSFTSGDFTLVGYSSDVAMTDFASGVSSITSGSVFGEGSTDYTCVISEELSAYNGISVGDTIAVSNTNNDDEVYELTVVGIYASSDTNDFSMSMFGASQDPANKILMSATALNSILDASAVASTTLTDENGREYDSKTVGTLLATYVFSDVEAYYRFEDEVKEIGLDDSYTVSSADVTAFENSLAPLETLSTMAGWFLLVILIIGGIILVVLNIFNVRERKYEVGVLTAMGMKKWKVAAQFVCEILVITMIAVIIGAAIGAVSSVPVTNVLLKSQIESQNSKQEQIDNNFGRPGNMGGMMGGFGGDMPNDMPSDMPTDAPNDRGGKDGFFGNMIGGASEYITEVNSAINLTVVLQMIVVGLLLTLVASGASVLFIMRYDPLKILANRD